MLGLRTKWLASSFSLLLLLAGAKTGGAVDFSLSPRWATYCSGERAAFAIPTILLGAMPGEDLTSVAIKGHRRFVDTVNNRWNGEYCHVVANKNFTAKNVKGFMTFDSWTGLVIPVFSGNINDNKEEDIIFFTGPEDNYGPVSEKTVRTLQMLLFRLGLLNGGNGAMENAVDGVWGKASQKAFDDLFGRPFPLVQANAYIAFYVLEFTNMPGGVGIDYGDGKIVFKKLKNVRLFSDEPVVNTLPRQEKEQGSGEKGDLDDCPEVIPSNGNDALKLLNMGVCVNNKERLQVP